MVALDDADPEAGHRIIEGQKMTLPSPHPWKAGAKSRHL
jgi:hypothetical protein